MRRSRYHRALILVFFIVSFLSTPIMAGQNPTREGVEVIAAGKFSPYAGRNFPTRVFFGGWDFIEKDTMSRLPADAGYARGVPMGGDLTSAPKGKAPTFLVAARKDPYSGNLDRIQIVKGWLDRKGKTHEKVYDVVWSGDRKQGTVPSVGNTVDV